MFVIKQGTEFVWPIEFDMPVDGGRFEKCTFDAIFKRLKKSQIKKLTDDETGTDETFVRGVMVGWKGVTDDNGAEIPFSETALESMLEIPKVDFAIAKAYMNAIKGLKTKN